METVSIIIPAYNEEKNLPHIINHLKGLDGYNLEIIVVDDGSSDRTAEVAKSLGVKVISYKPNRGKGAAFREAIPYVTGKYVVQIDADHQFQPSDIPLLLESLANGSDIVLGSRFKGGKIEKGSVTYLSLFGNWLMSLVASIFSGKKVYDVMAGFKAFKSDTLRALDLKTDHFGYEAEILVKGNRMGYKINEVPITHTRRIDGKSNVKKIRDGIRVLSTIISTRYKH